MIYISSSRRVLPRIPQQQQLKQPRSQSMGYLLRRSRGWVGSSCTPCWQSGCSSSPSLHLLHTLNTSCTPHTLRLERKTFPVCTDTRRPECEYTASQFADLRDTSCSLYTTSDCCCARCTSRRHTPHTSPSVLPWCREIPGVFQLDSLGSRCCRAGTPGSLCSGRLAVSCSVPRRGPAAAEPPRVRKRISKEKKSHGFGSLSCCHL